MNKKFQLLWWMILSILMLLFAILVAGCEEERDTIETIQQTEQELYDAKYAKLETSLYEYLQEMRDEDEVTVAIWIVGGQTMSEEEIYAELASRYPEVKEAMERTGDPFSLEIDDYDLMNEIENTYAQLRTGDVPTRIQPLVDYLEGQGYVVQRFDLLPALIVSLPKRVILEVASRSDVGSIQRADQPVETQGDLVVP